jgi:hypothetical protein
VKLPMLSYRSLLRARNVTAVTTPMKNNAMITHGSALMKGASPAPESALRLTSRVTRAATMAIAPRMGAKNVAQTLKSLRAWTRK